MVQKNTLQFSKNYIVYQNIHTRITIVFHFLQSEDDSSVRSLPRIENRKKSFGVRYD